METKLGKGIVAVYTGGIAVGKSTLVKWFCEKLGDPVYLEKSDDPFMDMMLKKFYADPAGMAFEFQFFMMMNRIIDMESAIRDSCYNERVHMDRMPHGDVAFARALFDVGVITATQLKLLDFHRAIMMRKVALPDIIFHLQCSTEKKLENIKKRGNKYEQDITGEYLDRVELHELFVLRELGERGVIVEMIDAENFVKPEEIMEKIGELASMKGEMISLRARAKGESRPND